MIGHEAYQALGERAYDYLDPMCGGGYLHGVIEQALLLKGMSYASPLVHDVCSEEMEESCLHGIGHGIHKLVGDIEQSLLFCDEIPTTATDCFDGVFMDAFDPESAPRDAVLSLSQAQHICTSVGKRAQPSCYFYLPRTVPGAEYLSIIDACSSSTIGDGWAACAEGSGVVL